MSVTEQGPGRWQHRKKVRKVVRRILNYCWLVIELPVGLLILLLTSLHNLVTRNKR